MLDKNMTLNELLRTYPELQSLLDRYYIDYCCGGHRTLQEAAKEHSLDVNEFLSEAKKVLESKDKKGL